MIHFLRRGLGFRVLLIAALLALSAPLPASSESASTFGPTTTTPPSALRDPTSPPDNSLRSSYDASSAATPRETSPTPSHGARPHPQPECEDPSATGHNHFGWEDYMVLGTMLAVSVGIGLFYACFGAKQKTADDFLLGGSSMGTFPMAMSLAAR